MAVLGYIDRVRTVMILALLAAVVVYAAPRLFVAAMTDTQYAPGYTESGFDAVAVGSSKSEALRVLGPPLSTQALTPSTEWLYCGPEHPGFKEQQSFGGTFSLLTFSPSGVLVSTVGQTVVEESSGLFGASITSHMDGGPVGVPMGTSDPWIGRTQQEILAEFGPPTHVQENLSTEALIYSRSPSSTHYLFRRVEVDAVGTVVKKREYFYWD